MKVTKYTFGLLALAVLLTASCSREEDNLFDKSAAERTTESVKTYTSNLAQAKGGWLMEYYPTSATDAQGVLICAKFSDNGMADVALINDYKDGKYDRDSSCWEIIADQGPVLTFNTYNRCIHYFCDPSIYKIGYGYEGDYEFVIISMESGADNAMLKGKKSHAYINLSRMPEGTDFEAYLNDIATFRKNLLPAPNYDLLHVGDSLYRINQLASGCPNIYPYGKDSILNESYHNFLVTKHSNGKYYLRFRDKFTRAGVDIQEFEFNTADTTFVAVNNSSVTITGADPFTYFRSVIDEKKGTFTTTETCSDSLQKIIKAISDQFKKSVKYTYLSFSLSKDSKDETGTKMILGINYKNAKGTKSGSKYYFTYKWNDNNIELAYLEPYDKAASNVLAKITTLQDLFNALTGTFTTTAANNKFNLKTENFHSINNPLIWSYMKHD